MVAVVDVDVCSSVYPSKPRVCVPFTSRIFLLEAKGIDSVALLFLSPHPLPSPRSSSKGAPVPLPVPTRRARRRRREREEEEEKEQSRGETDCLNVMHSHLPFFSLSGLALSFCSTHLLCAHFVHIFSTLFSAQMRAPNPMDTHTYPLHLLI